MRPMQHVISLLSSHVKLVLKSTCGRSTKKDQEEMQSSLVMQEQATIFGLLGKFFSLLTALNRLLGSVSVSCATFEMVDTGASEVLPSELVVPEGCDEA